MKLELLIRGKILNQTAFLILRNSCKEASLYNKITQVTHPAAAMAQPSPAVETRQSSI